MPRKKHKQTAFMSRELAVQLKNYCADNNITISNFIELLVTNELENPTIKFAELEPKFLKASQSLGVTNIIFYLDWNTTKQFRVYCLQQGKFIKDMVAELLQQELELKALTTMVSPLPSREASFSVLLPKELADSGYQYAKDNNTTLNHILTMLVYHLVNQ